jgi:hypothetical protein
VTRHRAPRGAQDQRARGRHGSAADTVPFAIPTGAARGRSRHRSAGRSALRRGALTAGIAGGALAVGGVAVPMLSAAGPDAVPTADLALSTQSAPAGPVAAVTPAVGAAAPVGAASSDLIKAVDRQRRAEADRAAAARAEADRAAADRAAAAERERARNLDCGVSDTYGGVADSVQTVANALECVFPGHDVGGVGSRGNASDHPGGYAVDFMTDSGSGSGDAIAECVMDHQDALGVSYAIWNQRINTGSGWKAMEDRGGRTANHEDHVHISFERGASPDVAALRGCGGAGDAGKA